MAPCTSVTTYMLPMSTKRVSVMFAGYTPQIEIAATSSDMHLYLSGTGVYFDPSTFCLASEEDIIVKADGVVVQSDQSFLHTSTPAMASPDACHPAGTSRLKSMFA